MNMKWCVMGFLVFVLCAGVSLRAQLSGTNTIEDIKARAEKGDAAAQFTLGYAYENGQGVATNLTEAFKWYSKAAGQTNAEAEFHVGTCYLTGKGLPTAMPSDFPEEDIVWMKSHGIEPTTMVFIEPKIAVEWFRKAALQDYAPAQYALGYCYFYSNGVAQDYGEAVKWYRKAAEQRNAEAQFCLGMCCFYGSGTPKDFAEAAYWYRKAAEQGIAEAQYALGTCYHFGTGVSQSLTEAAKWYRKAAEQGLAPAQFALGSTYYTGDGVEKDTGEGMKWWRLAAEQGNSFAQAKLGDCYFDGDNVIKDYVEAAAWYRKAAEQGDAPVAQYSLGFCYFNGFGVARNYVEAYKWINLAAGQGVEGAVKSRAIAEARMTPGQIAQGQKLSADFVPRKETLGSNANFNSSSPMAADSPTATGTGFFITDDGYLISNYHVVKNATKVRLLTSAGLINAKVVQKDVANDLALLKADGRFAALPIAPSRTVNLGGTVVTVGFPNVGLQGFAPKLAKGEIAALSGAADDPRYFQISLPVQPGNSGGALVDERGNAIGIVSAKLDASAALAASGALPENVNYAVKSSLLLSFLESLPEVSAKLKAPVTADRKFENVVKSTQDAAVLVLVY